jgi:hypothetical protein
MTDDATDERRVLRSIWAAEGQRLDVDEDVSPTKACRNMKDVTFDGLAEPGSDLQSAWKDRLAREGKLSPTGGSIRDLVLGPATDDDG